MDGSLSKHMVIEPPLPSPALPSQWYVAIAVPRAERIAHRQYLRLGIAAFLPLREMPPPKASQVVVEPIWPGYVFVGEPVIPTAERLFRTAPYQLEPRTMAPAVRGIVSALGEPVVVPSRFMEEWLSQADPDGLVDKYQPPEERRYRKDDIVQITCGAYAGMFATVAWSNGQKLKLIVSCFNRQTDLYLRLEQVTLASMAA